VPLGVAVVLTSFDDGQCHQVLRAQVACDVDVALLQQQALRGRLLQVAVDHARHGRLRPPVVVVALQRHHLVGAPLADLQRAGPGVVGLQPAVAQVARGLFAQHQLLVDHRGHVGRQAVQYEGRREDLLGGQRQRQLAGLLDAVLDVVLGEAELRQDEGRCLVQQHRALQRPGHVLGGHRVAAGELQAGLELEAEGPAVGADRPALGQVADQPARVGHVVAQQTVVGIAHDLAGRDLEGLGRVQRDDVVEGQRDDQRVLGRGGVQRQREGQAGGGCGQGRQRAAREAGGGHGQSFRLGVEVTTLPRFAAPQTLLGGNTRFSRG
jgi:hypothetical protein